MAAGLDRCTGVVASEQRAIMRSDVTVLQSAGTCGLRDVGNMIRRALPSQPVTSIRREDRARRLRLVFWL